jgi:hypothetical protein
MTSLKDIQDYVEDLCKKHVGILHLTDGRRGFARLTTDDHITQIKKKATPNIVVISAVNGQRIGDIDENKIRRGVSIIFASHASTSGGRGESVDAANNKSESIMFDFMSRLQKDFEDDCPLLFTLELEKITWDDIEGPWLDNYYGWIMFIPFKTDFPEYDDTKWNS